MNPMSLFACAPTRRASARGSGRSAVLRRCGRAMRAFAPIFAAAALVLSATMPQSALACATCGCSLSSDAAMGYSAGSGWRVNVEYDYIDQNQLRGGSGLGSAPGVPDGNELEHDTTNIYTNLGISYSPDADWNISLRIPYVDRNHTTYGIFDSTQPLPDLSHSHSSSLGDIKLIGSYQGFLPTHNLGVQFGVKLPTGAYGTAVKFDAGPNEGSPLDASLQPGTGSTDLIIGGYYYQAISQDWDAFANGTFQAAVRNKQTDPGNDFRIGNLATVSVGLRYEANPEIVPQVQINLSHKSSDQGALADTADSAGTVAYLSPGVTVSLMQNLQVYSFVQIPVYSRLQGFQLAPRWTASLGVSYAF
jgi:hypothetical protein